MLNNFLKTFRKFKITGFKSPHRMMKAGISSK